MRGAVADAVAASQMPLHTKSVQKQSLVAKLNSLSGIPIKFKQVNLLSCQEMHIFSQLMVPVSVSYKLSTISTPMLITEETCSLIGICVFQEGQRLL